MESFESIKIGINNIDLLVIRFVKFTVDSFIHRSQAGIKYILTNFKISHITKGDIFQINFPQSEYVIEYVTEGNCY